METPKFEHQEDADFATGRYVFENYEQNKAKSKESNSSDPIIVEGVGYLLKFYPNGFLNGKDAYISVGIQRVNLTCLNLDTCDKDSCTYTMLHSSDRSKDVTRERKNDWLGKESYSFTSAKFYAITDI